jgi:predicted SAM-dependent methyltransferase
MANYIFLNVGCGPIHKDDGIPLYFRSPNWCEIRVDIDPATQPDIVASITDLSCILSNSVDCVWSSHNLEHLYSHEVETALREFLRVLKPSGFMYLKVPDLELVAQIVVSEGLDNVAYDSPAGPITPLDMIYGHGASIAAGNFHMAHRTGFTPKLLMRLLRSAGIGYGVLKRKDALELSALAFKDNETNNPARDRILAELEF